MKKTKTSLFDKRPLQGLSVCFDLDGTLVDTAPDLVRVTNEVISARGHGPVDYRKARAAVGYGSRRMITDALADVNDHATEAEVDAMQAEFLSRYADTLDQLSRPFAGVEPTLARLTVLGAELSVCTNKPGWLARPLLEKLALDQYFIRTIGGDEPPQKKPSAGHIFTTAGHRNSARIVMVGDSWPDMRAAQNAGVHAILMTYGYTPLPQIRLRADTRLSRFRDIVPTLLARYH
ncbi:phosphoglycolate phosphatase [Litorimonas cladophorae]|uniref:phosphoglycolate phosphatase n=1 Tax=Litorimonas cladophorae TaxID=1220491 RepID=A0A918KG43_9PROT|nr:HAD-IA family hydrolase [Litorimonas cladophorae]GGX60203.1 phosphoglycolate phosphatase [Litorimonas cladophorae]